MNTYLKVTILVLAAVCVSLAGLLQKPDGTSQHAPNDCAINDVGHAEAIDYRNFQYRPQEAENKYYLTRWAELYFNRNRFTLNVIKRSHSTSSIAMFNAPSSTRNARTTAFRITSKTVPCRMSMSRSRTSSSTTFASLRIGADRVREGLHHPADHTELKRERWTASVTYVFRENVKNNELAVPPRLTIVRFRADQAFS